MKRVELYTMVLNALGVDVSESGRLSVKHPNGELDPIFYDDKPFYLPTKENLAKSSIDTADWLFFDPLTENMSRVESESIKLFRDLIHSKLCSNISFIVIELINILRENGSAEKANTKQLGLFRKDIPITSTTKKSFTEVVRTCTKDNVSTRLLNIFLKRGEKFGDMTYSRLAVVSYPVLDAFESKSNSIFGVEMSAKDKTAILQLICYTLFGDIEPIQDAFTVGSNSNVAPYFQSLCYAYINVATRLNDINSRYRTLYTGKRAKQVSDMINVDLSFAEHIEELAIFKKDPMPVLPGNNIVDKNVQPKDAPRVAPEVIKPVIKVKAAPEIVSEPVTEEVAVPSIRFSGGKRFNVKSDDNHDNEPVVTQSSTQRRITPPDVPVRRVVSNPTQTRHVSTGYANQPTQRVVQRVVVEEPPVEEVVEIVDQFGNHLGYEPVNPQPRGYVQRQTISNRGGYQQGSSYVSRRTAGSRQPIYQQTRQNIYGGRSR